MEATRNAMNLISYFVIPLMLVGFPLYGLYKRVPVYESFVEGAKEGFQVAVRIIPYLVAILDPVTRDGATGALEREVFEISARLGSSKRIGRVVVAAEDFSEANGCLSAQFKVRRQHVLEKYRGEIAACYPG